MYLFDIFKRVELILAIGHFLIGGRWAPILTDFNICSGELSKKQGKNQRLSA